MTHEIFDLEEFFLLASEISEQNALQEFFEEHIFILPPKKIKPSVQKVLLCTIYGDLLQ